MELLIPIVSTGYRGLNGWGQSIDVQLLTVRHHSFFPGLRTGQTEMLNEEAVGVITPSLIRSYIITFNPSGPCFKLHCAILTF